MRFNVRRAVAVVIMPRLRTHRLFQSKAPVEDRTDHIVCLESLYFCNVFAGTLLEAGGA
jgi:hypothetical protein